MLCTHKTTIFCQFGNLQICPIFANPYLTQFSSISGGNCINQARRSRRLLLYHSERERYLLVDGACCCGGDCHLIDNLCPPPPLFPPHQRQIAISHEEDEYAKTKRHNCCKSIVNSKSKSMPPCSTEISEMIVLSVILLP